MGDAAKISPCIPSTCLQNAILPVLIIRIIPSRQIDVATDNPLLILSISCLTTSSYLWNYLRVVLATVPVFDPAGIIGLRGNGLTPSKIDDFLSEPSL